VFDSLRESRVAYIGAEWVIAESKEGHRYQVKLLAGRDSGNVKDVWFQRVFDDPSVGTETMLHLQGANARRFVELLQNLAFVSVAPGVKASPIDEDVLREVLARPETLVDLYNSNPNELRAIIVDDRSARDVVALAHRKAQVGEFRRLLDDDAYFDEKAKTNGPEAVWRNFFEANPWIFGVSLAGQLVTAWDAEKLEQVVVGSSIAGAGKRTDALLRTAGRVRSMIFLENKHHRTKLLDKEYRTGCWTPHREVVGGVVQLQGTVQRAMYELKERFTSKDSDGADIPGDVTYLLRPRSYLVVGRLDEFLSEAGGHHQDKIKSFELYRRHLDEPEIITFDELYARAEWLIEVASSA
jgi:hypothetical protein